MLALSAYNRQGHTKSYCALFWSNGTKQKLISLAARNYKKKICEKRSLVQSCESIDSKKAHPDIISDKPKQELVLCWVRAC